ncbi:hypothetical protein TNCV_1699701 [Trichonephila clavipes]|nr:hypothetical protein TNCV_1699701 [Trichonephila clavipes]
MSIVRSSVPCERLFSIAGNIASDERNRFYPIRLHRLLFLKSLDVKHWELVKSCTQWDNSNTALENMPCWGAIRVKSVESPNVLPLVWCETGIYPRLRVWSIPLAASSRSLQTWRENGSSLSSFLCNKFDRFGGKGILVCGGTILDSRTPLYIIDAGTVNSQRCRDEILELGLATQAPAPVVKVLPHLPRPQQTSQRKAPLSEEIKIFLEILSSASWAKDERRSQAVLNDTNLKSRAPSNLKLGLVVRKQEESIRTGLESVVANGVAPARERRTKLSPLGGNNCDVNGHLHPNDTQSSR